MDTGTWTLRCYCYNKTFEVELKSRQVLCMYSLLLSASHYAVLMGNAAPGSDAHNALMRVLHPAPEGHRGLMCNAKTIEELLDLAVRVCPDAVLEISRQIQTNYPT